MTRFTCCLALLAMVLLPSGGSAADAPPSAEPRAAVVQPAIDALVAAAPRTVYGWGNQGCTILTGQGWTCTKVGTGVYDIGFSPAFNEAPAVTAVPVSTLAATLTIDGAACGNNKACVRLRMFNSSGAPTDRNFKFIAISK